MPHDQHGRVLRGPGAFARGDDQKQDRDRAGRASGLAGEADIFMDLGAHALKVLSPAFSVRLGFSSMASANWTNIEEVVLENQYVNAVTVLVKDIPTIRNGFSDNYFRTSRKNSPLVPWTFLTYLSAEAHL